MPDEIVPLVFDRGLLRKYLFYHPNPPFDVVFVVSSNYQTEEDFGRIVTHPKVRYFAIQEPWPDMRIAAQLIQAILDLPKDVRVAVACTAGVNRSATVASIIHAHRTGLSFCRALQVVRQKRTQAAPFWHMAAAMCLVYEGITGNKLGSVEECCGKPDDFENYTNFSFNPSDFQKENYEDSMKKWNVMATAQAEKVKNGCDKISNQTT